MELLKLIAILSAAVIAVPAAVLPLLENRNRLANSYLSGFLLCVVIWLVILANTYEGYQFAQHRFYLLVNVSFLMGPFLHYYTQALSDPHFKLTARVFNQPMPALISAAISLPVLHELATETPIVFSISGSPGLRFCLGMGLLGFLSLSIYGVRMLRQIRPKSLSKIPHSPLHQQPVSPLVLRFMGALIIPTALMVFTIEGARMVLQLDTGWLPLLPLSLIIALAVTLGFDALARPPHQRHIPLIDPETESQGD